MKTKFLYITVFVAGLALTACGGSSSSSKNTGGASSTFDSEAGATLAVMMAQGFVGMAGSEVERFEEEAEATESRSGTRILARSSGVSCDSGSHTSSSSEATFTLDGKQHSVQTEVDRYDKCVIEAADDDNNVIFRTSSNGRIEQGESGGYFYTKATGIDNDLTKDYLEGKYENFSDVPGFSGKGSTKSRLIQYGKDKNGKVTQHSYADMEIDVSEFQFKLKMGKSENEKFRLSATSATKEGGFEYLRLDGYLFMEMGNNCGLAATFKTKTTLKMISSDDDDDGDVIEGMMTVEMDSGSVYNIEYKDGAPYVNGSIPTEEQMMKAAMAMSGCEASGG